MQPAASRQKAASTQKAANMRSRRGEKRRDDDGRGARCRQEPAASDEPNAGDEPATGDEPASGDEAANGDEPTVGVGPAGGADKPAAKQTTISFILSGRLKPGLNWLAFPADLQNVYGLRIAVPAGLGWTVPLPKLDFSGQLDAVAWEQPLGRLDGAGLVRRGQLVAPPAGATVLARFSDGAAAVARVGNITFATSDQSRDWSQWIEEAVRIDWTATKPSEYKAAYGDPFGMHKVNRGSGDPVQADGAQVAASLLCHPQAVPLLRSGARPTADRRRCAGRRRAARCCAWPQPTSRGS